MRNSQNAPLVGSFFYVAPFRRTATARPMIAPWISSISLPSRNQRMLSGLNAAYESSGAAASAYWELLDAAVPFELLSVPLNPKM
jgi:hypothetical protein